MKIFNISAQSQKLKKAWTKEYFNQLESQINSLYEYLHYYNPEWRLLGLNREEDKDLSYYTYDNTEISESSIILTPTGSSSLIPYLDIQKLNFRWGLKNRSNTEMKYGGESPTSSRNTQTLNIGATIYKKDSYDVTYSSSDFLSHFIVFEAALAQYITWTINTTVNNGQPVLEYSTHLSNELDFGLQYSFQVVQHVPRYFYRIEDENTPGVYHFDYRIKYRDHGFDTETLFDYTNYDVKCGTYTKDSSGTWVFNNDWSTIGPGSPHYVQWAGATELFPNTVYKDTNVHYEDLIGDIILYERPGKVSEYQVRLDKNTPESGQDTIEQSFEVIFS